MYIYNTLPACRYYTRTCNQPSHRETAYTEMREEW